MLSSLTQFKPQAPQGERKELAPAGCSLTSTQGQMALQTPAPPHGRDAPNKYIGLWCPTLWGHTVQSQSGLQVLPHLPLQKSVWWKVHTSTSSRKSRLNTTQKSTCGRISEKILQVLTGSPTVLKIEAVARHHDTEGPRAHNAESKKKNQDPHGPPST